LPKASSPKGLNAEELELRETARWLLDYRNSPYGEKLRHREGLLWNVPGFSPLVVLRLLGRIEELLAK